MTPNDLRWTCDKVALAKAVKMIAKQSRKYGVAVMANCNFHGERNAPVLIGTDGHRLVAIDLVAAGIAKPSTEGQVSSDYSVQDLDREAKATWLRGEPDREFPKNINEAVPSFAGHAWWACDTRRLKTAIQDGVKVARLDHRAAHQEFKTGASTSKPGTCTVVLTHEGYRQEEDLRIKVGVDAAQNLQELAWGGFTTRYGADYLEAPNETPERLSFNASYLQDLQSVLRVKNETVIYWSRSKHSPIKVENGPTCIVLMPLAWG